MPEHGAGNSCNQPHPTHHHAACGQLHCACRQHMSGHTVVFFQTECFNGFLHEFFSPFPLFFLPLAPTGRGLRAMHHAGICPARAGWGAANQRQPACSGGICVRNSSTRHIGYRACAGGLSCAARRGRPQLFADRHQRQQPDSGGQGYRCRHGARIAHQADDGLRGV